jgi:hypothetical protein
MSKKQELIFLLVMAFHLALSLAPRGVAGIAQTPLAWSLLFIKVDRKSV